MIHRYVRKNWIGISSRTVGISCDHIVYLSGDTGKKLQILDAFFKKKKNILI